MPDSMDEKTTGATRWVDDLFAVLRVNHFYRHFYNRTRREILTFLAFLLWVDEIFKRSIHDIQVCMGYRIRLQSGRAQTKCIPSKLKNIPLIKDLIPVRAFLCRKEKVVKSLIDNIRRPSGHTEFHWIPGTPLGTKFVVQLGEKQFEELVERIYTSVCKCIMLKALYERAHI